MRHAVFPLLLALLTHATVAAPAPRPPRLPSMATSIPDDLSLEKAYDITLASDQAIRIAFLEVKKANLLALSALTRIAPRLNGSYGYERIDIATEPAGAALNRFRRGVGIESLSLDQTIVDFSAFPARRRGKFQAEGTRLSLRFSIRQTLFGVASAYYEVLKRERILAVNRQSLELATQQEQLAQKRADVGEVTRSDILRAKVSVETARRAMIASENTLELQRNTLRNILNFPPDAPLHLREPSPFPQNLQPFEDLLQTAWTHREDLQEREMNIHSAEERRKEIIASYGPRILASGVQSLSQTSGLAAAHSENWSASLTVQVPFFSGGQREIDLATSRYNLDQAVLDKERVSKNIEAEVKRAWLDVRALDASLRAAQAQLQAAEQGYTDIQNQYSAGTAKSLDVLTALNDLNTVRSDLAALAADYQVALRSLEQVTGTFQQTRVLSVSHKR